MAKFKLLLGSHIQAEPGWEPSDEEKEDAKMRGTKPRAPSRFYRPGEIVETDLDLVARFGPEKFQLISGTPKDTKKVVPRPGEDMRFPPVKEADPEGGGPAGQLPHQQPYPRPIVPSTREEELDESERGAVEAQDEQKKAGQRAQQQKDKKSKDDPDFDTMTLKQLQEYAEEEEIDLKGARTKDEVLKAVKKR
jgi:hypothetical protein